MRFIKRDKPRYFGKTSQMAARPIKYDFTDPVLNREFLETVTHHNQVTFRMRNDPTYAKQVNAQLNLYNREKLMKLPEAAPPGTMFNRSRNSATAGHDWNTARRVQSLEQHPGGGGPDSIFNNSTNVMANTSANINL